MQGPNVRLHAEIDAIGGRAMSCWRQIFVRLANVGPITTLKLYDRSGFGSERLGERLCINAGCGYGTMEGRPPRASTASVSLPL